MEIQPASVESRQSLRDLAVSMEADMTAASLSAGSTGAPPEPHAPLAEVPAAPPPSATADLQLERFGSPTQLFGSDLPPVVPAPAEQEARPSGELHVEALGEAEIELGSAIGGSAGEFELEADPDFTPTGEFAAWRDQPTEPEFAAATQEAEAAEPAGRAPAPNAPAAEALPDIASLTTLESDASARLTNAAAWPGGLSVDPSEVSLDADVPANASGAAFIADALERVARRIRAGDLDPAAAVIPVSDEGALAVALAALLAGRRG